MLELEEKGSESRYDTNLIDKYWIIIWEARYELEKIGPQVFLGETEPLTDSKLIVLKIPIDARKEMYRIMSKYPNYTLEQLKRVFFRESEFYPCL